MNSGSKHWGLTFFFCTFIFLIGINAVGIVSAASMEVEKHLEQGTYSVGENIPILLNITNPFTAPVVVKIQDENAIGGSQITTVCEQAQISPGSGLALYKTLKPLSSGEFTLGEISLKYVNPETAKEEIISSTQDVSVTVTGSSGFTGVSAQTIQNCVWDEEEQRKQQEQQQKEQQKREQQQAQENVRDKVTDEKLQNNQQNQDSRALKEQLAKEAAEQQQREQAFKEQLASQEELTSLEQSLAEKGYDKKNEQLFPENATDGEFSMNYTNEQGDSQEIKGEMENGELTSLSTQEFKSPESLMETLSSDSEYSEIDEQLRSEGFTPGEPSASYEGNQSELSVPYTHNETNESAIVHATFENETITEVVLDKENKNVFWWIIVILLLVVFGVYLYRRYFMRGTAHDHSNVPVPPQGKKFNYRREALSALAQAEKKFPHSQSYELVSYAVRLYVSHTNGDGKEVTSTQATKLCSDTKSCRECLNLCNMVEFAQYKVNKKDFDVLMKYARKIVK